jgi:mRNA-degrading endonuclease RelE of RelBE toxin-antitoxin system
VHVSIDARVEIAARSLDRSNRARFQRALTYLEEARAADLGRSTKIYRRSAPGESLYIYRVSERLRLVFLVDGNNCALLDLVDRTRLNPSLHMARPR